jgi:hypothetical protein
MLYYRSLSISLDMSSSLWSTCSFVSSETKYTKF